MSLPIIAEGTGKEVTHQRFELTNEHRSKGGKRVTEKKLVQLSLARRKWCGQDCPIFPCAWAPLSTQKYEGRCALKEMPPATQQAAVNLYHNGLEGLQAQAVDILAQLTRELEEKSEQMTRSERRQLLRDIALVKETFYGKKFTIDGKIRTENTITVDILRSVLVEVVQDSHSAAESSSQLSDESAAKPSGTSEKDPADPPS